MRLVASDMASMVGEHVSLAAGMALARRHSRRAVDETPVSGTCAAPCRVSARTRRVRPRVRLMPVLGEDAIRMTRLPEAADQPGNAAKAHLAASRIPKAAAPNMRKLPKALNIVNIQAIQTISNIPVNILRGLFSGVGRLFLAADRFREAGTERDRYG